MALPRNSAVRKVNELVKRTRLVRTHAHIISHLQKKMPVLFGKESTQKELIDNLPGEFREIERTYKIPLSDFPDVQKMQEKLRLLDFSNFPKFSERLMIQVETVLSQELPLLMKMVSPPKAELTNPFSEDRWIIDEKAYLVYQDIFAGLDPVNGNIPGGIARDMLLNTGIALDHLRKIWELVDFEKDGKLDCEELALALYLTEKVKMGEEVPDKLAYKLVPPSKRRQYGGRPGGGGAGQH